MLIGVILWIEIVPNIDIQEDLENRFSKDNRLRNVSAFYDVEKKKIRLFGNIHSYYLRSLCVSITQKVIEDHSLELSISDKIRVVKFTS